MHNLRTTFFITFTVMLLSGLGMGLTTYSSQSKLSKVTALKEQLFKLNTLANELKTSSDKLSQFARSYANTRNERWLGLFNYVLLVRQGKVPLPSEYTLDYWDKLSAPNVPLPQIDTNSTGTSIIDRLEQTGIQPIELAKLRNALAKSDALVNLESRAFNAMKGLTQDQFGNWNVQGEPNFELARKILFSDEYFAAKANIMTEIEQAYHSVESRLNNQVKRLKEEYEVVHFANSILIILLVSNIIISFYLLWSLYIKPVATIQRQVVQNVKDKNLNFKLNESVRGELSVFTKSMNFLLENISEQLNFNTIMKDFGMALRGKKDPRALGEELLQFLEKRLPIPLMGLYVIENDNILNRVAGTGYCASAPKKYTNKDCIHFHVVETKKPYKLRFGEHQYSIDLNGERLEIEEMHYFPLTVGQQSIGLLELGCLESINDSDYKWVKSVIHDLAISLQLTQNIELQAKAEKRVSEQLELNKKILDAIPNPMYYKDKKGLFLGVNSSFHRYFGTFDADVLSAMPSDIFSPHVAHIFEESHQRLIANGSNHNFEIMIDDEQGNTRSFVVYEANFTNEENVTDGGVGLLLDVTERKQMEKELIEAKIKADEMSSAKGEFLANMSHEIRTPMNAIIGMSHLALKTDLTKQQYNYVNKIDLAAKNLLGIINDVLDFSKIESGKLALEEAPFSLQEVLDNVVNINIIKVQEKDLELLLDVAPDIPLNLIGDPLRLGQILINLVGNAIKFTQQGEIKIIVTAAPHKQGVTLSFTVQDSGIGMTPNQQKRLFQAFSQADGSITRKYGGTGLGLSISKRLVELMQGEISVTSTPNKGSAFSFNILCKLQDNTETTITCPASVLKGKRVLVVDDNESAREILTSILSAMQFEVQNVASGLEAIDLLEKKSIDILFIDWKMPKLDGIETIEKIRSKFTDNPPKCILVTAHGSEVHLAQSLHQKVDALMLKPVDASQVNNVLSECFNLQQPNLKKNSITRDEVIQLNQEHILLVEDNETNQEVASEMLQQANLQVTIAEHGQAALDLLSNCAFDLILMDMQMPVMDGLTAAREIRKQSKYDALPIIAMTANAMQEDVEKCTEAGMNAHIAKPINFQKMITTIQEQLNHSPILVESTAQPHPEDLAANQNDTFHFEGLDHQQGIERLGGNEEAYWRILKKFVHKQIEETINLSQALVLGDYECAHRLAHSLKGSASNLGAYFLEHSALDIEQALANQKTVESEQIDDLTSYLRKLNEALSVQMSDDHKETGTQNIELVDLDKTLLAEQFNTLNVTLAAYDASSKSHLMSIYALNMIEAQKLRPIEEHIENFDFEQAQLSLNGLRDELGC
ncbi:Multi-sensor hybrid histidine kinase [Pseudoalteromonas phenolica]|uniref:histidine kinase n=2 Tax=Pseudoalteromonas phenolica TaxID=161398 RepID=A0A0S2JYT6_9GAMM|nr:Multi-sensor hybrid histidine kinase [Pseudoalteromonas phenolica]